MRTDEHTAGNLCKNESGGHEAEDSVDGAGHSRHYVFGLRPLCFHKRRNQEHGRGGFRGKQVD